MMIQNAYSKLPPREDVMPNGALCGILIPFFGTALGSACVFFMKKEPCSHVRRALSGFAGGVMTAASVWSLLIPAIEQSAKYGKWAFAPAFAGFWLGILFMLALDRVAARLHGFVKKADVKQSAKTGNAVMALAVTLHNIPEGMAVGIAYAATASGRADIAAGSAFAIALGIAIQNFPEGAIISMPVRAGGKSRAKAFLDGVLSGAVEPVAAALTFFAAGRPASVMPYLLSFAAGAMIYVAAAELIPEMSEEKHNGAGILFFTAGFTLMMALDAALG